MKELHYTVVAKLAQTGKFSAEQLIFLGNNALCYPTYTWGEIVKTGKLSIDQMFEVGKSMKEEPLWEIIANQLDWLKMTSEEKIALAQKSEAEKTGAWAIGNAVADAINWAEISLDQKIELVKLFPSSFTGNNVTSKFIASIDWFSLTPTEIMGIGDKVKNEVIWKKIIETGKLSKKEMIELGKREENYSLWVVIWETAKFSVGFTTDEIIRIAGRLTPWQSMLEEVKWEELSNEEKIELGNKSHMWDLIAKKIDWVTLGIERAIKLGFERNDFFFWRIVAEKADWSKLALTPKKKIEMAQKIKNWDIWTVIVQSINWLAYSQEELLEIGKRVDHLSVWQAIISTKNLSVDQMFEVGKSVDDDRIWKAIIDALQ